MGVNQKVEILTLSETSVGEINNEDVLILFLLVPHMEVQYSREI